nr:hypothetical protein [Abalone asfa-like virus]
MIARYYIVNYLIYWMVAYLNTDTDLQLNQDFNIKARSKEIRPTVYYVTKDRKFYILFEKPIPVRGPDTILILDFTNNLVNKLLLHDNPNQNMRPGRPYFGRIIKNSSIINLPTKNITHVLKALPQQNSLPNHVELKFREKYLQKPHFL